MTLRPPRSATPQPAPRRLLGRCQVLREDPDLLTALPAAERDRATAQVVAGELTLAPGRLTEAELRDLVGGGIGLLVLEGLLLRRVTLKGRSGAELLGQGDVLRPLEPSGVGPVLGDDAEWRVLERARVAMLDDRFVARLAPFPALIGGLAARMVDRARSLTLVLAIIHQPRIEVRLRLLFWLLAERWGRVRADGVLLPLQLSHSLLADLVCARRPSVTVALQALGEEQLVQRTGDGWLLLGEPPFEATDEEGEEGRDPAT